MGISDKAISNAYYMFLSWIVLTVFAFLFQLVAIKLLTQEEFGIALTATNLAVFIGGVLTLGLSSAIQKLIPEYYRKRQMSRIKNIVSRSFVISLFAISVFTVFFILNLDKIASIVKIPRMALVLVSITYFIVGFTLVSTSVIYGFQNMRRYFFGGLGYATSKFMASTVLILLGFGFFGPIIGVLVGFIVWFLITLTPENITLKINSIADKELFRYSFPGLLNTFTSSLFQNAQFVLLTIIKTAAITGIFGVGMLITSTITVIPNLLLLAIFPIISELSVDKKSKKTQKMLVDYTLRYSLFLTFPMIFILSIFSGFFILLISRPEYLGATILVPILAFAALLLGVSNTLNGAIYATRKPKVYRNILVTVSGVFLITMPFLATAKGDLGMAIAFLSAMVLYLVLSFIYLHKGLKIDLPINDLAKIILASVMAFSPLIIFKSQIDGIIAIGLAAVASGLLYVLLLLLMRFYKKQDARVLIFLKKKFKISHRIIDFLIEMLEKNHS